MPAIGKEVRVEKVAVVRNIGDRLTPVQSCGGARAEHILHTAETAVVGVARAAVEVPHAGGEGDSGGVDEVDGGGHEIPADGPQTAAHGSHPAVDRRGFDELLDKARDPVRRVHDPVHAGGDEPLRTSHYGRASDRGAYRGNAAHSTVQRGGYREVHRG